MNAPRITGSARRADFKTPPIARQVSQDERRHRALEEQKRLRAQRINAARNIDLFSSLSLGGDDEDEDGEDEDEESATADTAAEIVHEGLGAFASMLDRSQPSATSAGASTSAVVRNGSEAAKDNKTRRRKKKGGGADKHGSGGGSTLPSTPRKAKSRPIISQYANVCMYAELLELRDDDTQQWDGMSAIDVDGMMEGGSGDTKVRTSGGLPNDLENGWVVLAPIPVGKRCLAVSYQHQGGSIGPGIVSSTHLHSRLKGTTLLKFPSPLPPDSILDCILDVNWELNGIIHVLDILRWRGTDFVDCEAEFRFWWRDARLSEITLLPPSRRRRKGGSGGDKSSAIEGVLVFDYPIVFLPVPHHTPPIALGRFLDTVIPAARTVRKIEVPLPVGQVHSVGERAGGDDAGMDVDVNDGGGEPMDEFGRNAHIAPGMTSLSLMGSGQLFPPSHPALVPLQQESSTATIGTDGLLLYVSEASYQPGETPLSCWIPANRLDAEKIDEPVMLDVFEKLVRKRVAAVGSGGDFEGMI